MIIYKLNKEMATIKDKLLGHCACHGSHTLATVDDQLKNNLEFIWNKQFGLSIPPGY